MKKAKINLYDDKKIKKIFKNIVEVRKAGIGVDLNQANLFIKKQYREGDFNRMMGI